MRQSRQRAAEQTGHMHVLTSQQIETGRDFSNFVKAVHWFFIVTRHPDAGADVEQAPALR